MANPVNASPQGEALESFGFTNHDTIAGIGLLTFGFLWPANGIWSSCNVGTDETAWVPCGTCSGGACNV